MGQKSYKVRNTIWLTLEDEVNLRKAWEPVSSYMATNQLITRIVQFFLSRPDLQVELMETLHSELPAKVLAKEKKEEDTKVVYVIQCPFCGEKFPGQLALQAHLTKVHGAVQVVPEGKEEVVKT